MFEMKLLWKSLWSVKCTSILTIYRRCRWGFWTFPFSYIYILKMYNIYNFAYVKLFPISFLENLWIETKPWTPRLLAVKRNTGLLFNTQWELFCNISHMCTFYNLIYIKYPLEITICWKYLCFALILFEDKLQKRSVYLWFTYQNRTVILIPTSDKYNTIGCI